MHRSKRELWYAFFTVILITAGYIFFNSTTKAIAAPGSIVGHLLGIVGFILMLMTETLYSVRKRNSHAARWGRSESWLRLHIFTGIVGPYMVFLHTVWRLNGLAGVVTFLTAVIVISGFVGSYVYTLIPRTILGLEIGSGELETRIRANELELQMWYKENPGIATELPENLVSLPHLSAHSWGLIVGAVFQNWCFRWRWHLQILKRREKRLKELRSLLIARLEMNREIASLVTARHILALWHTLHVPLGIALFIMSFVHIGATIYYVTLAK
jgi:hypothetical protein